jgi:SAM-dependent methyltransferase
MYSCIPDVCRAITAPRGEDLLRLMYALYRGPSTAEDEVLVRDSGLVGLALGLGLIEEPVASGRLTAAGYLVGNVAKEYCYWVDAGRRLPSPCPPESFYAGKTVLDLGCSFGRWLWGFQKVAGSVLGIELQQEYIELGKALAHREGIPVPRVCQGSAEELDRCVPHGSVDFVFTRLVLSYAHIMPSLRGIFNILRPGGIVWIQVEPLLHVFRDVFSVERNHTVRSLGWNMFRLLNSLLCTATGHQAQISVRGRMHSVHKPAYPPLRWWQSTLPAMGWGPVHVIQKSSGTLVFWAQKQ